MRLVLSVVAVVAVTSSPALSAIAPEQQRMREFQTVLARAGAALGEPVEAVERAGPDLYRIRSSRCTVEARIVDARAAARAVPMPGRRRFRVTLGEVSCR